MSHRVMVALDFATAEEASRLVDRLDHSAHFYRVGIQLLTAAGPSFVRGLVERRKQVFLDLKLLEIPNSVKGAIAAAGELGVSMVTVHASGGTAVLKAAVEAARPFPQLKVIALTVITSMRDSDLAEVGVQGSVAEQVSRLARLAVVSGCHGVVASPLEARELAGDLPEGVLIVTPGVRLESFNADDQARTATPRQAIASGATHLVVGRSITKADDPVAALKETIRQIS